MVANLVTAPAALALAVADAKTFLRVDGSDEDTLIEGLIKAATRRLEALTDKKFITQTWDIYYDHFPYKMKNDWWDGVKDMAISELHAPSPHLNMPFGPLNSVTGVYTYDESSTEYQFDSSNYVVDTVGPLGRVSLKDSATWPTTVLRPTNGVKVRGIYGMGANQAALPFEIVEAIKHLVGIMYEHRGDELPKIPASVSMLIEPYRSIKVGC